MFRIPDGDFAAYIFDCDGTLADTMPIHYRAWVDALRQAGWPHTFTEELFYSLGGVPTPKIIERLNVQFGTALSVPDVFHLKEEVFREYSRGVQPVIPVVEFARGVIGRKPTAVASGGPRVVVMETLERIGLAGKFDVVVTADDVDHGKPSPDMFLLAARRLGVEPSRCLVFEDAEPGWRAAEAAGMACVVVHSRRL
jgi:HAD superfamily hydrolase (TIGR01509 family)